jgi:DNA-binding transcriptional MerR regulator
MMFKIGDFSRLTRVSIKTLRHYDEIGLFKPTCVDKFTGYRYYSFEQLPRLNHILALKTIGFSLDQIANILDANPTRQQLQDILHRREAELEQQIVDAQEKLSHVTAYLQLISEGTMPDIQVIIRPVEPVTVVGARKVGQPSQMRDHCMSLENEVTAYIRNNKLKCVSPSLALYHDNSADGIDVEMAYYIEQPEQTPTATGNVQVHRLPAVPTMASAVYHGSYDAFEAVSQVYAAIGKWIEANGYQIKGASRELYLQPPDWSTSQRIGVMEIQFPVEKV